VRPSLRSCFAQSPVLVFLGFSSCVVLFYVFCSISLYGSFICSCIMCVSVCRPIACRYSLLYNCTSLSICMWLPFGIINDEWWMKIRYSFILALFAPFWNMPFPHWTAWNNSTLCVIYGGSNSYETCDKRDISSLPPHRDELVNRFFTHTSRPVTLFPWKGITLRLLNLEDPPCMRSHFTMTNQSIKIK